jgi:hypothetical protein
MIRARLSNGDFIMGVDLENILRLTAGLPIVIDLKLLGGTDRLLIMYGETLDDIKRELERASGQALPPETPYPEGPTQ